MYSIYEISETGGKYEKQLLWSELTCLYEVVETLLDLYKPYIESVRDWVIMTPRELDSLSRLYNRSEMKEDSIVIRDHVDQSISIFDCEDEVCEFFEGTFDISIDIVKEF